MSNPGYDEHIDGAMFQQILEMDDNDDHEFSKTIVTEFFENFPTRRNFMQKYFDKRDLESLEFISKQLKNESKTLGLTKVGESAANIEIWARGTEKDEPLKMGMDERVKRIAAELNRVRIYVHICRRRLYPFYGFDVDEPEEKK